MNGKRMFGIAILVVGFVLLGFSFYIKNQVAQGKMEIRSAERKVEKSGGLFNLNPVTKEIGDEIRGAAESKINEGKRDIAYYSKMANLLQIGGIVCIIVGLSVIVMGRKKRE